MTAESVLGGEGGAGKRPWAPRVRLRATGCAVAVFWFQLMHKCVGRSPPQKASQIGCSSSAFLSARRALSAGYPAGPAHRREAISLSAALQLGGRVHSPQARSGVWRALPKSPVSRSLCSQRPPALGLGVWPDTPVGAPPSRAQQACFCSALLYGVCPMYGLPHFPSCS